VAALAQGALTDISINGLRTNPGKATSKAEFVGILNINDQSSAPHTVSNVTVFDSVGVGHVLSVKFTNNNSVTPRSWLVEAKDDKDKVLTSGEIRFNADGTPAAGFNSLAFSLAPEGVAASMVTLFFGDPGATSGARSIAVANSDLQLDKQDGFAVGSLTKTTFDERGVLMLTYSNGQTTKHERLALASFSFLQRLEPREGGLFVSADDSDRLLGSASEGPFGGIAAGRVEISNVDLAQEFSDLIISQRGYQASSQVISSANEMMQQLFDIKARR
jgi:flagellar hook protein FlgE